MDNGIYKNTYKPIGFEYTGFHITMNEETINTFSKRYIRQNIISEDFYPTYAITRQIKNDTAVNLNNLENNLEKLKLFNINSVFRYFIDNTFIYYSPSVSLYNSIPYENKFVISFLSNKLGNTLILERYPFLYKMMNDYYGFESEKMNKFTKIVYKKEDAIQYLKNNYYLSFEKIPLYKNILDIPKKIQPRNIEELNSIFKTIENSNDYYFLKSYNIKNLVRLNADYEYLISPYILYTYINGVYKAYLFNKSAFYVFTHNNTMKYKGTYFFPEHFNELSNVNINTDKIQKQIRELASDIAKMFSKYVIADNNQINGFFVHNLYLKIMRNSRNSNNINDAYEIMVSNSDYTIYFPNYSDSLHNYIVDEYLEWINELVIKPSMIPGYKTNKKELHYQSL